MNSTCSSLLALSQKYDTHFCNRCQCFAAKAVIEFYFYVENFSSYFENSINLQDTSKVHVENSANSEK